VDAGGCSSGRIESWANDYGKGSQPHRVACSAAHAARRHRERQHVLSDEYINADIYMPAELKNSAKKAPAVLWLCVLFLNGYGAAYRRGDQIFYRLAKEGYVVFCFHHIGTGRRIESPRTSTSVTRAGRCSAKWSAIPARRGRVDGSSPTWMRSASSASVYGHGVVRGAARGRAWMNGSRLRGRLHPGAVPPGHAAAQRGRSGALVAVVHGRAAAGTFVGQESARAVTTCTNCWRSFAHGPLLVVSPTLDREARVADVTKAVDGARARLRAAWRGPKIEQVEARGSSTVSGRSCISWSLSG